MKSVLSPEGLPFSVTFSFPRRYSEKQTLSLLPLAQGHTLLVRRTQLSSLCPIKKFGPNWSPCPRKDSGDVALDLGLL